MSVFGVFLVRPHFPAFGLNTERYGVSLCIQSKCGKIRTRNTPNRDIFHAMLHFILNIKSFMSFFKSFKQTRYERSRNFSSPDRYGNAAALNYSSPKRIFQKITSRDKLFAQITQPAITCSELTIEILEQRMKYIQSQQ